MAITIDWPTKVINVPKADTLLIQSNPIEIRQLDLDVFRLALKALEDDAAGMVWPKTHNHNPPVTVGGAVLARVVEIVNDYTVTFEDGAYAVNLVGANSNVGDVLNLNTVQVRSANSAGLQDLNSLQAASFGGEVALKPSSIYSGDVFPVGTRGFPVNNTTDAKTILQARGMNRIVCLETQTIDSGTDWSGLAVTFRTDNPSGATITIAADTDIENCSFENMTVQGTLDGNNIIRDSNVLNINFFNGEIHRSGLAGTVTLGGGIQATIVDSFSAIAGSGPNDMPVIDMGGSGQELALRSYSGGLKIINGTGANDNSTLDMEQGRVVFDATVTAGTYTVRGIADVTDNSTGTAVVNDLTVTKVVKDNTDHLNNKLVTDPTTGRMTLYEDDGVTVKQEWDIWEDVNETVSYRGKGAEVRDPRP